MTAPRAVVDSNVLISAIAFGGKPEEIRRLADRGEIEICLSPFILDEVRRVLTAPKFSVPEAVVGAYLEFLRYTEVDPGERRLGVSRDPDDDPILECADACGAEFTITGDRDLLDLRAHGAARICSPADFLAERAAARPASRARRAPVAKASRRRPMS